VIIRIRHGISLAKVAIEEIEDNEAKLDWLDQKEQMVNLELTVILEQMVQMENLELTVQMALLNVLTVENALRRLPS
jgi:16S rRNA U1498 N3-methylase RsmE